ncbi:MAG: methionine--tRNA ligase [Rickettsiales bacterium]|jgi:methionyl-tRNA synthetase|nr:methionine--tRNA ligase [Rickettsiales bacterium]
MKYLITSALPYVNAIPHIGNFVGSILPADVYARFRRARHGAENVLFTCGADAHGSPIVISAKKENMPVAALAEKYHAIHAGLFKDFHISLDGGYGTTHTDAQVKLVHDLFNALEKNGFVEEKTTVQPYSVDDEMFLADRQIEGTCPKCGYEKARGDQCDKCGELLDPADLINPYSADTGSRNIEMRETKNLFYRADLVRDEVEKWFADTAVKNGWSKYAVAATKKYLGEDVPNPSITRDLPWGIPVNKPGYEDKVFYVWFDAPWGYVSISQLANDRWADWWHGGENCHYAQFMGKDNIKFHSLFFPGQEFAWRGGNWKKVDLLKGLYFLNFEGDKISKSNNHGIFLDTALEDAPADAWRYALMASAPETDDTDFTIQRFADIVNKDLNGMLGNFVSRVCKLTEKNFGGVVPGGAGLPSRPEKDALAARPYQELESAINSKLSELTDALEKCEFRKGVAALREIWAAGNEFMTRAEPWALIKNGDTDGAAAVLNECFQLIDFYARVSSPFIPATAAKMQGIFGGDALPARPSDSGRARSAALPWPAAYERRIADNTPFIVPENLFERIDDAKVTEMMEKYTKKSPKIVIAKILTVEKHPESDRLNVLSVDAGDGKPLQIVCGCPNVHPGLIGVLAKIGALLPGSDTPIAARKMRGVVSYGMMCGPDEIGLSDKYEEHLAEMPEDSVIGTEFKVK